MDRFARLGRNPAACRCARAQRVARHRGRLPLALLASFWIVLATSGCITIDLFGGGEESAFVETVVRGRGGPKILLVDIDGVIDGSEVTESFFGAPRLSTVARVREMLDRARADRDVRAVLLRIDSPGGTATASEQVYTEVMRFRSERNAPVTAQLLTTAASGGYYIAMAADTVQAHPTTVTGSIGVIFTSLNFAGLMEKMGVEDQTITGGVHKDVGSPFRRLTPEERGQLQSVVDDLHARFKDVVVRGRPKLTAEDVAILASGRIYSAPQALANGLVDRIGTLEEAVIGLEQRLGVGQSRVVTYHRPNEIRRNLYTQSALPAPSMSAGTPEMWAMRSLERIMGRPGFHYLWWPGLQTTGISR